MSRIELYLLGAPLLTLDSAPIQVDTRKAIALMAYLAVTGERHRRDALAALLWPDADQARARAALRRTLSTVKKALAGCGLRVDRETVVLDWDADLWVDLVQFRSQKAECLGHAHGETDVCDACLDPLQKALDLYRGDLLAGFTLRDSPAFDDWESTESESLRRDLADVLQRLAQRHSARGEFDRALAHTRRRLVLDLLDESVHRLLMQLYFWAGQRSAALNQYRECVRVLDRELGVAPLEETHALYQAIRSNQAPPSPVASAVAAQPGRVAAQPGKLVHLPSAGALAVDYRLVGRSTEWATLLEIYASAGKSGRFVVVEGEAGIGKTRLVEEFLTHARARGAVTAVARCYRGQTDLAFAPFIELLGALVGPGRDSAGRLQAMPASWLGEASRLLPDLVRPEGSGPGDRPLDSLGAQVRFFEAISQIVLTKCEGPAPAVIFFDDLHWADEASVDLLAYLVRRLHSQPLCIVATWRSEDVAVGHRLRLLLSECQRAGFAAALTPRRLNVRDVAELVKAASANLAQPHERLEERLHGWTDGLPFFVVEYLSTLIRGEAIGREEWPTPTTVKDLLITRLSTVDETGRQLVDTAAVIGRSFDLDILQEASGRGEDEVVASLEGLQQKRIVREVKAGEESWGLLRYDFQHEQLRALAYEGTSLARRKPPAPAAAPSVRVFGGPECQAYCSIR